MSEQVETRWIPANENDIGKLAQFFDFPGDDPVYGVLLDTDGSQDVKGVKCCNAYWCDTGCDDDEPLCFNCCEVQENRELTAAQQRVAGHIEHIKQLEAEVAELRAVKFRRFNNEDCWIYQCDGDDHMESLVCPVVMSAKQAMEFEKAQQRVAELERSRDAWEKHYNEMANKKDADNARLRALLREWIEVTCDYANLELVVVDSGLIERSKAAIGEGE